MAIDYTKPVETNDGRPVRILCTDAPGPYPVCGIVEDDDEGGHRWTAPGHYFASGVESPSDLRNVLPARVIEVGYINVYKARASVGSTHVKRLGAVYISRKEADCAASGARVACVKLTIEYTEGQFDD